MLFNKPNHLSVLQTQLLTACFERKSLLMPVNAGVLK